MPQKKKEFWPQVEKKGPNECWLWTGKVDHAGFGRFGQVSAHRHSYSLAHGGLPSSRYLIQSCGNHRCVNPSHLREKKPVRTKTNGRPGPKPVDMVVAFWGKVDASGKSRTDCWNWKGGRDRHGSPKFRKLSAVRFAFELFHHPLRPCEWAVQRCNNPDCVSPYHLQKERRRMIGQHREDKIARRFWSLVRVAGPTKCWMWAGSVGKDGSPHFREGCVRRYCYSLFRSIPPGKYVKATCKNRHCLNPNHLFVNSTPAVG